jgi:ribosomal protein S18 acetylase RimI-like enzyme
MLGYIVFSRAGHIISIAVLPLHRRRGIGKQLLYQAMKASRPVRLRVEVRRSNQGAQTFYSRIGFQMIGMVPNYYGNEDALIMEWTPPALKQATSSSK